MHHWLPCPLHSSHTGRMHQARPSFLFRVYRSHRTFLLSACAASASRCNHAPDMPFSWLLRAGARASISLAATAMASTCSWIRAGISRICPSGPPLPDGQVGDSFACILYDTAGILWLASSLYQLSLRFHDNGIGPLVVKLSHNRSL